MSLSTDTPTGLDDDATTAERAKVGDEPRQRGHGRAATLPTVNLLSPSAFERLGTRRLRRRFTAAGVAVAMLVAAAWGAQHLRVASAEQQLRVEQGETERLQQESEELLPVRALVSGVQQQADTVGATMARELYFSQVLKAVRDASPYGVQLDAVVVTVAAAPTETPLDDATSEGAACPGPDPFQTLTVAGCITLAGSATNRAEVGDLVTRLGDDRLFIEPFISTTTTDDGSRVVFNGSVGLSEKVFTERYADVQKLIAGKVSR